MVLILVKGRDAALMMVEVTMAAKVIATIVEVVVKAIVGILLKKGVGVVVIVKMMHLPRVRRVWMRMVKRCPSTTPKSLIKGCPYSF